MYFGLQVKIFVAAAFAALTATADDSSAARRIAKIAPGAGVAQTSFQLRMRAGAVDTSADSARGIVAGPRRSGAWPAAAQKISRRGVLPYLVQFAGPVDAASRQRLAGAGARVVDYIPDNALLIEVMPALAQQIAGWTEVQWIGEYGPQFKIRPDLATNPTTNVLTIVTFAPDDIAEVADEVAQLGGRVVKADSGRFGKVRAVVPSQNLSELVRSAAVQWIEEYLPAKLHNDLAVKGELMNVTNVWTGHGLTGAGQVVGHADTGLDTGNTNTIHQDFFGRIKAAFAWGRANDWSDTDSHGTHTAGSILGSGVMSTGLYRGVAFEAQIVHQSLLDSSGGLGGLPADLNSLFIQAYTNGARVHSDSWGSSAAGKYTSDSQDADTFMWNHPDMLLVFSAGNSGTDKKPKDGIVDADSMGAPATAKNLLAVGGTEVGLPPGSGGYSSYTYGAAWPTDYANDPVSSDYISQSADGVHQGMVAFSSRGPTDDGRIKPDIVAPGSDIVSTRSRAATGTGWGLNPNTNYMFDGGTSMACPLTAGAAALVRQFYTDTKGLAAPDAALIKATMINGARTLTPGQYGTGSTREIPASPRPNSVEGWGQVNLENSLFPAAPRKLMFFDDGALTTGKSREYSVRVNSATNLNVSLAWTDYPGNLSASVELVNDLDLLVIDPDGQNYFPNGLPAADRANNVEGVDIAQPKTGAYLIRVSGYNVPQGPQPFALVISGDADVVTGGMFRFSASAYQIVEANTSAVITVQRTGGSQGTSTVQFATGAGTATAGADFAATNGTLTFAPGVTSLTFAVQILNDVLTESDETIPLVLQNATNAIIGMTTQAVVTIIDDDAPGVVQIEKASYTASEDSGAVAINVVRTGGSLGPVSVQFSTANGSATGGLDYLATNGTLTFAAGEMSKGFSVELVNDSLAEGTETLQLLLTNATGGLAIGAKSNATLVVLDDDSTTNTVLYENFEQGLPAGWSVVDYQGNGAVWRFDNPGSRANLTGGSGNFAIADSDYYGLQGMNTDLTSPLLNLVDMAAITLRFKTDFHYKTNSLMVNETAEVDLSNDGGATWWQMWAKTSDFRGPTNVVLDLSSLAAGHTNVLISFYYHNARHDFWWEVDDVEVLGQASTNHGALRFAAPQYIVGENGGAATINVSRDGGAAGTVSVQYFATNGTAVAGADFIATTGTLVFASGVTSAWFTVPVIDDELVETNKNVQLTLAAATGGATTGTPAGALLRITDNDGATGRWFATAFDSGLPAGWTITNKATTNAGWRFDNPGARTNNTGGSGTFAIADSAWAGSVDMDTELRTPPFDLAGLQTVFLEFKSDFHWYAAGGDETAAVEISPAGTSGPWTPVWQRSGEEARGPSTETVDVTSLAALRTNVVIKFHYSGVNGDWWWQVDDVRISGNTDRIDSDGDGMPDWWEAAHNLPVNIPAASTNDADGDGVSDLAEFLADTDPQNPASFLAITAISNAPARALSFLSSYQRNYDVECATSFAPVAWGLLQGNVPGNGGAIIIADTNAAPFLFYRLRTGPP